MRLYNWYDQIWESFEENKFTLGVFIDFSKAFDIIDHNILLEKLLHYGVNGNNLKWFSNYLKAASHCDILPTILVSKVDFNWLNDIFREKNAQKVDFF